MSLVERIWDWLLNRDAFELIVGLATIVATGIVLLDYLARRRQRNLEANARMPKVRIVPSNPLSEQVFHSVFHIDNPTGGDLELLDVHARKPRDLQLMRQRSAGGGMGVVDSDPSAILDFGLRIPGERANAWENCLGRDFFVLLPAPPTARGTNVSLCFNMRQIGEPHRRYSVTAQGTFVPA